MKWVLATGLLAACTSSDVETSAPLIREPLGGAIVDRCLLRARINVPGRDATYFEGDYYAAYRVDGGSPTRATNWTQDRDAEANFLFPMTLHSGANHVEIGRCGPDGCGWSAAEITIAQHAGAPDCAAASSGQLLLPDMPASVGRILPDGRWIVAGDMGSGPSAKTVLTWLRPDGTLDTASGSSGITTMPFDRGLPVFAPRVGGGWLGAFARGGETRLVGLGANGMIDPVFGTAGVLVLKAPDNRELHVEALAPTNGGGFNVAGTVPEIAGQTQMVAFAMHIDDTGVADSFTIIDDGINWDISDVAVDAAGRAVAVAHDAATGLTHVAIGGTIGVGLDTAFGANGVVMLSAGSNDSVVFHGSQIAIAQGTTPDTRVTLLAANGTQVATVDLALASPVPNADDLRAQLWSAADGALFVATTSGHPADIARSWSMDPLAGTDLAVAKIRNGALDTTFGDAGISRTSLMLTMSPISSETLWDVPIGFGLSDAGVPAMVARSLSTPTTANGGYTYRDGVSLVTLVP